jgi:hypothetical protein
MTKAIKKIGKSATGLLGGITGMPMGIAGKIGEKVLGKLTPQMPVAASESAPVVMPSPNDSAIKAARRRVQSQLAARSGRQSTMLSTSDTLG